MDLIEEGVDEIARAIQPNPEVLREALAMLREIDALVSERLNAERARIEGLKLDHI